MVTAEEMKSVEHDLASGEWVPSESERALGRALLECHDRLECAPCPADMRPGRDTWDLWLTQGLDVRVLLAREISKVLLPRWRGELEGSRIFRLAEAYTQALAPVFPHAERLLAAWQTSAPGAPTPDRVAQEATYLGLTLAEAERDLRYQEIWSWELTQLRPDKRHEVEVALEDTRSVGKVIYAAVAGSHRP
ncbi:hypothetical protein AB8O64_00905 [Streptomyces sp. QH1-20]|uniref:hypothetical protein n=1 Tax=Streptomyces sp. QH1-20 TaxID=3240934 RepID=UPI0035139FEF